MIEQAASATLEIDDNLNSPPVPWKGTLLSLLGLFGAVPLALFLGLCGVERGPRLSSGSGVVAVPLFFSLFTGLVHAVLVFPMVAWVYPGLPEGKAYRLIAATFLISLPLAAFAYYLGDVRTATDGYELLSMVVPAVFIGALLREGSGRAWLMSLFIGVTVFVPLFVLSDVLGPFPAYWSYYPEGAAFYWLRAMLPSFGVLAAVFLAWDTPPSAARFRWLVSFLVFSEMFFGILLPTLVVFLGGNSFPVSWIFSWVGYLPVVYFLSRPAGRTWFVCFGIALVEIGLSILQITRAWEAEVSVPMMGWVTHQALVLGTFLALAAWLLRRMRS